MAEFFHRVPFFVKQPLCIPQDVRWQLHNGSTQWQYIDILNIYTETITRYRRDKNGQADSIETKGLYDRY